MMSHCYLEGYGMKNIQTTCLALKRSQIVLHMQTQYLHRLVGQLAKATKRLNKLTNNTSQCEAIYSIQEGHVIADDEFVRCTYHNHNTLCKKEGWNEHPEYVINKGCAQKNSGDLLQPTTHNIRMSWTHPRNKKTYKFTHLAETQLQTLMPALSITKVINKYHIFIRTMSLTLILGKRTICSTVNIKEMPCTEPVPPTVNIQNM